MDVQKSPLQKTYQMSIGTETVNIEFYGSKRQFDWLEISLVCDKNLTGHLTIYDSYNVEVAAKLLKSVALENFTEAYSLTNERKI